MGRISDWISFVLSKSSTDSASELQSKAEHGDAEAQYYTKAVRRYQEAADQGDVDAQYNLGYHYFAGLGVPQNYVLAHMWFSLAASSEDIILPDHQDRAIGKRDLVASKMTRYQIAEAQRLAREWKPEKEK